MIGAGDGFFVVFDDDHGISLIAQPLQSLNQLFVVSLVQADTRLVKNVKDPDQVGTDLSSEPNTLGFAAGQSRGGAREGQIRKADVDQERQPGVDLFQNRLGDQSVLFTPLYFRYELPAFLDRQFG